MNIDALLTPEEAAARLGCGTRHLAKLADARRIKYIQVGLGGVRPRKRYHPADIEAFIDAERRMAVPCPLRKDPGRRTGTIGSNATIVAFTDLVKQRTSNARGK